MSNKGLVTVTGASGFIAQHTVNKLLEEGYAVRGTVRDTARIGGLKTALANQCDITHLSFVEANLSSDTGWHEAMEGAKYLLHMASPLPTSEPDDENDLIVPARDGALRAVKAAAESDVERIVMTSSIASVAGGNFGPTPLTEETWSDLDQDIGAYSKSKTIAERAVWDFVSSLPEDARPELAMINPGFVLGPLIAPNISASHEVVRRLLAKEVPGIPNIDFNLVDVRDVAEAHITALTSPAAPGNRYICVNDRLPFEAIAKIVHDRAAPKGFATTLKTVPDWLVKFLALFKPDLRIVASRLGKDVRFDTSKIRADLNFAPVNLTQSIEETVDSLIENKMV
ncbi:MAG: NAD-dependent epimerase/dehydratase family protein [Proteobacteria bacterium]|nr:NAD-dependent epimerase/dehydratase family protein [Pseudomonadota bacterium]